MVNYQIRISGQLDESWSDWFNGWKISQEDSGDTLLAGPAQDEAELYGILAKIRQMGLKLVSVQSVNTDLMRDESQPATPQDHGNAHESG